MAGKKSLNVCTWPHGPPRDGNGWVFPFVVYRIVVAVRPSRFPTRSSIGQEQRDRKLDAFDSCAASVPAYRATRVETQKLVDELRTARMEHRKLLSAIRNQIAVGRKISFDWTTS